MTIEFEGKVAIVTGAGGGLGRTYALELAARGAKVVVNDLGGAMDGTGGSSEAADGVVGEIEAAGGEAVANGSSVTDKLGVQNMIKQTMNAFGRVDILINNAGILRDKTFTKMDVDDFRAVVEVHLMGSVLCTKAVWPIMREQEYGRIVMTSSVSGIWGNFGQSNYGAAKMGLLGFMNVLKLEGHKYGIHVNTVSPGALTRMTESIMPEGATGDSFSPQLVTPAMIYLASDQAPTGVILQAGGGRVARIRVVETQGVTFEPGFTADDVAENYERICAAETLQTYAFQGAPAVDPRKEP